MVQIIIGCFIAQIVIIAAIGGTAYYLYKKNESKIKAAKAEVESKIASVTAVVDEIEKGVKDATEAIGEIKSAVDEVKNGKISTTTRA